MLYFKPIEIFDIDTIRDFMGSPEEMSCENSPVNLVIWSERYKNMFAVEDGILIIKSADENGNDIFRLPFGADMAKGFQKIFQYCDGKKPPFWNPDGQAFSNLPGWFSKEYNILEERDSADYIYLQSNLANLSGKKYHSKRNHISAFSKKYRWQYSPINDSNKNAVLQCADQWYSEHPGSSAANLKSEREGVVLMLNNLDKLGVKGGAILVENRVVAFTLGSAINSEIYDIHIEKALSEFGEAYTVINREFASRELSDYRFINREEDMGLEGLRKSKLSYNPTFLLKKYYCSPKNNDLR